MSDTTEHFICVTCDELFEPAELTKQGQCAGCLRHMPLEDSSDDL